MTHILDNPEWEGGSQDPELTAAYREMNAIDRAARHKKIREADLTGWTKKLPSLWVREINGAVAQYWPTTGRLHFRGETFMTRSNAEVAEYIAKFEEYTPQEHEWEKTSSNRQKVAHRLKLSRDIYISVSLENCAPETWVGRASFCRKPVFTAQCALDEAKRRILEYAGAQIESASIRVEAAREALK